MVFSSAIFLFAFFPILYVIYRLVPGMKAKNGVLIAFSLLFYCFGGLRCLPLLLISVLVNWGAGRILGAMEDKKKRKPVVTLTVIINLGLLAVFKYLDFFVENLNALLGTAIALPGLVLPLGISFFTFTGLSYVLEVNRKPANMSKSFWRVLLYISLFPNILSGPILSYKTVSPQIDQRVCSAEKTAQGLRRFIAGMAKKVLISDILGGAVDQLFASTALDARLAWLAVIGYALQIYFDFSGYTDMALGIAKMFGFDFPENFEQPYTALDMTDFWKRWHISLTTWFRNYLYMPMVISAPLQKLYKKWSAKYGRAKANRLSLLIPTTVVWLLTGLWHGASWTYVLWGLWHGLFCLLEGLGILRTQKLKKTAGGRALLHLYTIFIILLGTVLFRAGDMQQVGRFFAAMFTGWHFAPEATLLLQQLGSGLNILCFAAGLAGAAGLLPWLKKHSGKWGEPVSYVVCAGLFVLSVMCMAGSGFQPFIYLQF